MTPPRPTGFGWLSALWWPVWGLGIALAAVVMALERVASAPGRPENGTRGPGRHRRAGRRLPHGNGLHGAAIGCCNVGALSALVAATLAACCPDYSHAAGGPPRTALVDNPFLPPTRTRSDLVHLTRAAIAAAAFLAPAPVLAAADQGEWIVFCPFANARADANPVDPAARYLYDRFGNGSITTGESYAAAVKAPTTCATPEDHAAYLSPSLYKSGRKIDPKGAFAGRNTREKIYYTAGHYLAGTRVEPFPPGFKMIHGFDDARSIADANAHGADWGGSMWWGCADDSVGGKPDHPVNCRVGIITIHTEFESCWNGRLASGDEVAAGNVVYPSSGRCPASHPRALPMLETRYEYPVGTSGSGVTLSSGGYWTYHSVFWNTWQQTGLTRLVNTCMNQNKSCGENPP